MERDLPALVQRLAESLARLFGERLDLARLELRADLGRLASIGAGLLLALAAAAVGLMMVALALLELLAPLVASRPARLLLVGVPLLCAGTLHARAAARRIARERLRVAGLAAEMRDDARAFTAPDVRDGPDSPDEASADDPNS